MGLHCIHTIIVAYTTVYSYEVLNRSFFLYIHINYLKKKESKTYKLNKLNMRNEQKNEDNKTLTFIILLWAFGGLFFLVLIWWIVYRTKASNKPSYIEFRQGNIDLKFPKETTRPTYLKTIDKNMLNLPAVKKLLRGKT